MRKTAIVLIGILVLTGCNTSKAAKGTLSGTVTYKGQAVNGGSLFLYDSSGQEVATIPLDQQGIFRSSDVPAGDFKVVIEPSPGFTGPSAKGLSPAMQEKANQQNQPATIRIPDKYKKAETSDLTLTVAKSGETKVTLEFKD